MDFIELDLDQIVSRLKKLSPDSKAAWGSLSAQGMVEHLSDSIDLAIGKHDYKLAIPEEVIPKAQRFIDSEHPMPKFFKVEFTTPKTPLRNSSIESSIDEFVSKWHVYHTFFEKNPSIRTLHPSFGEINYEQWNRVFSKHLTHHFEQFGI